MSDKVLILDYKTGNVDSVIKAVKILGSEPIFSFEKEKIDQSKKIILPGQGSYNYAMKQLINLNLVEYLKKKIDKENIPSLGICLGMQILSSIGKENENTQGLNLIPGETKMLKNNPHKLPHLGWNSVKFVKDDKLFDGLKDNQDYYFIHSFYFDCNKNENIIATSEYNQKFPSIIKKDKIYGIQFHPEKSLKSGLKILENFLNIK